MNPEAGQNVAPEAWPFTNALLAERLEAGGYLGGAPVSPLLAEANASGVSLVELLRSRGLMTDPELRDALSYAFGFQVVDRRTRSFAAATVANFPPELIAARSAVPIGVDGANLQVAVADPTNGAILGGLHRATGFTLDLRLATPGQLEALATSQSIAPAPTESIGAPILDDSDAEPWAVGDEDDEDEDEAPKRGSAKQKAAWIAFASRLIAQAIGAFALVFLGLALVGELPAACSVGKAAGASHAAPNR